MPAGSLNKAVNGFGVLGGATTDFSQGSLQRTDNPYDFAIEGSGYFVLEGADGAKYTRAGDFHLRPDRTLVNSSGDVVMGEQGAIRIPEGRLSVSADGTLSVDGAIAGRLRVVEFPRGTELTALGSSCFTAPAAAAIPATVSTVRQGMVEGSNVDAVGAAVGLIRIQRNAETLQRALSLFHNEMNRIAAEDLARI